MTMYLLEDTKGQTAKIKVIGVGGGGGNAVNNMIDHHLRGVEFIAANTDAQAIDNSKASQRIQLGAEITRGLGAGADPKIGRQAAEAEEERLREFLQDTDMVFITAGMGGGTGTGAAPIIAEIARELGILTVAVVTKPFNFEGNRRLRQAEAGIAEMRKHVDTLIIIPNQKLIANVGKNTPMIDAFRKADDVLLQAVRGIAELITHTGYINVDFADVNAVMRETRGMAMMGSGVASGENRACEAAERAISSPLLEDVDIHGARGILVNVTGSEEMTLAEYDEAISIIYNMADEDANIICGMVYDQVAGDEMRVTVVATGLSAEKVPQLDSVKAPVQEHLHLTPTHNQMPRMATASAASAVKSVEAAVSVASEHSGVMAVPGFAPKQEYDEATLQVPTWIRRQAD